MGDAEIKSGVGAVTFVDVVLVGHATGDVHPGPLNAAVLEIEPVASPALAVTSKLTVAEPAAGTLEIVQLTIDPVTEVEQVAGDATAAQLFEPLTNVVPDGTVSPMVTFPDTPPVFCAVRV